MNNLLIPGVSQNAFPTATPAALSAMVAVIPASPAEQAITVPAGAVFAKFTADANFYATFDASTVAVPGDTAGVASTVSCLNPDVKHIRNVATIKVNATGLAHVTVEFFK